MDWPGFVRRYVWDEQRTPYLVRSNRLSPAQARSELFTYGFLLAILAAVVAAVSLMGTARVGVGGASVVAAYALAILVGAIVTGASGHPGAAVVCATAPAVMAAAALLGLLRPGMAGAERLLLGALGVAWLVYAARIVRIARRVRPGA
jgi:hypothetical protein